MLLESIFYLAIHKKQKKTNKQTNKQLEKLNN